MKAKSNFFLLMAVVSMAVYTFNRDYQLMTWNNVNLLNFAICLLSHKKYKNLQGA